jgi:lipopolysaccharide biosynthesis glycosyltransferase
MTIDCVLCFRDESGSYFINAYITLLSLFRNTREHIAVHILHDETLTRGKAHLEELCRSHGHDVHFHAITSVLPQPVASAISQRFNIGATYLYYAHERVAADKAVYLDCDVIVNRNILDLHCISLDGSLFAGVPDCNPYWKNGKPTRKYAKTIRYLGLKEHGYINSGLLLMNLRKLRELSSGENIFAAKTVAAIRDGITLFYPDMDIINSVAAMLPDGVRLLDPSFNRWSNSLHMGIEDLRDTIFHYVSKPDSALYPAHLLFWKYYAMSPFAGDMFERMAKAYGAMDFVRAYLANPRQRRHAEDLLRYGMAGMLLKTLVRRLPGRLSGKERRT